jgi:hypothetical protein
MDAAKFETSNEWHKNVTKETITNGQNQKMVSFYLSGTVLLAFHR